jgi:hypothetical protein
MEPFRAVMDMDFREFPRIARQTAMKPLQILDAFSAEVTWKGAYSKAKNRFNMGEMDAIKYADDVVLKTQGSGSKLDIAPVQYSTLGRVATLFQTFVINDWKFLTEDVFKFGKGAKLKDVLPKVLKYTIATAAFNHVFEDLLGIKSPFPRPIKALFEGLDNNQSMVDTSFAVGKEFIEPIPVIGNARYGKGIGGPAFELTQNIFTGGKFGETPKKELTDMFEKGKVPDTTLDTAGKLMGIPGTAQATKSYRAWKRGETPWGIMMGTYSEKKGGGSNFYSRPSRPQMNRPTRP